MARGRVNSLDFVLIQLVGLVVCGGAVLYPVRDARFWLFIAAGAGVCVSAAVWNARKRSRLHRHASNTNFIPKSAPEQVIVQSPPRALSAHERLNSLDWYQFKSLVAALYEQKTYKTKRLVDGAQPQGIDFVLEMGGIAVGVQCKHWKTWIVGVKTIQEFLEQLKAAGLSNGRFVALKDFSKEASEFASKNQIQLVDGNEILKMMSEINWASNLAVLAVMEDKKKRCPKCESEMFAKTSREGASAGQEFWECRSAPGCNGMLLAE
jgi:HJR/Mrr/RecB family endonuclease